MRLLSNHPIRLGLALAALSALPPACRPENPGTDLAVEVPPPGDSETTRAIRNGLNTIVNEAGERYRPLIYEYDEGLLAIADRAESHLSGKSPGPAPRFMPSLDEAEELDHFRITIRRWEAQEGGRSFRAAIDPLIAEVAARKPGEPFHPDFHKRFGVVFDSFIPIEVQDARERKNRAIHAKAKDLFAPHRAEHPAEVKPFEAMIDQQYPEPKGT